MTPVNQGLGSVALQHALDQIAQRTPVVLASTLLEPVLIDEQDVVLETRVQMRLEAQVHDHLVVVAVDVCVDAVQALEQLPDRRGEVFGERDADARRECRFVVDVRLHPRHQMLDVPWRRHLGGLRVARRRVLPEVFESVRKKKGRKG